jgi:Serine protease inhibitor
MKKFICLFALAFATLTVASCDKTNDDETIEPGKLIERKDIVLTRAQMEMVRANNAFALDLFARTAKDASGESFLISPLSVTYALGMVDNGAKGKTQEEINSVLGYDESTVEGLNAFCKTMLEQSAQVDPSTTIEIANTAVVNKVIPLLPEFTEKVESNYEAVVTYKDFEKDDVMGFINSWCDQKTHGMIPVLLEDPVDPSTYAHFLNAIYFKGIWSHQFKKADTSKEKFTLEDGSTRKVDMMHQKTTFSVGGGKGYSSIILPYGNQAYRMTVLLPAKGVSVKDVMDGLTVDSLDPKCFYDAEEVDLKLPAFESEFKIDFSDILCDMGMPTAFSPLADFSAMTTAQVCISQVLHKAKIKVDETGSEAAAVTDVTMKYASPGPGNGPKVFTFHADHPFIYAITEVSTGAIFFIGQYTGK